MGKEDASKKTGKSERDRYILTGPVEAYKQRVAKEEHILANQNKQDINKLESYFATNNNYLSLFKTNPDINNSKAIKVENPVDAKLNVNYVFCQKCHRDQAYCKHIKQNNQDENKMTGTLLNSQVIGWRQPIDTIKFDNGRKNHIGGFYIQSLRDQKPKTEDKK